MTKTRTDRIVTDNEIVKYKPMVEAYLKNSVQKNWNEASLDPNQGDVSLGNSGYTMNDIRQHLLCEVVIALKNYDPSYKAKESTFVYGHLSKRVGQLMKKLTKKSMGYGVWTNNLEEVLREINTEE
jgi:hypothetical protein